MNPNSPKIMILQLSTPYADPIPQTSDPQNFKILLLYYVVLFWSRDNFVNIDANWENHLLMSEYCYCGDDWHTVSYFSVTAALLELSLYLRLKQQLRTRENYRRRRYRKASEGRSVAPRWPRLVARLHRSAGGGIPLSFRTWSIHLSCGRPRRRFHWSLGGRPGDRSTWQWRENYDTV